MLESEKQARIDKAIKELYDYIDSLPPGQREKALEYQQALNRKAAANPGPNGMLDACISELKKFGSAMTNISHRATKSLDEYLNAELNSRAKAAYEFEVANYPDGAKCKAWEDLTAEQKNTYMAAKMNSNL